MASRDRPDRASDDDASSLSLSSRRRPSRRLPSRDLVKRESYAVQPVPRRYEPSEDGHSDAEYEYDHRNSRWRRRRRAGRERRRPRRWSEDTGLLLAIALFAASVFFCWED